MTWHYYDIILYVTPSIYCTDMSIQVNQLHKILFLKHIWFWKIAFQMGMGAAAVCDFSLSSCLKPHHIAASSDWCIVNYCSHNCTLLPSAPCIASHRLSCDCREHLNLNGNNDAEWENFRMEQNLSCKFGMDINYCVWTRTPENLTSRIKIRVRGPICPEFLRC